MNNTGGVALSVSTPFNFGKVISGAGTKGLWLGNSGIYTLSGNSTYTGPTLVDGNLLVNGDNSAATGTVTVNGALGGSGSIGGFVDAKSGSTLNPGAQFGAVGTLTLGNGLLLNSGSTLNVQMGAKGVTGGGLNDLVAVTGNLTLGGTLNVAQSSGGLFEAGKYPLFTYTGTLTGDGNSMAIGSVPAGIDKNLLKIDVTTAGVVYLVFGGPNWDTSTGNNAIDGGTGSWTASAASTNWTSDNGKTNGPWEQDKSATFAGSAGTVTVDNGAGAINYSGLTFETSGYTLTGGVLTGTGGSNALKAGVGISATLSTVLGGNGINKQDGGSIFLTGANTYSGATSVTGGILSVGTGGTVGSIDNTTSAAVSSGATLRFDRSNAYAFAPVISGAGALNQAGSGTLTLTGANTYTGATTVTAGTLAVGNGGTTGSIDSSSSIALSSGTTLQLNRSDAYTSSKVISGAGALVQAGSGTTTLSATNTYTGSTSINAGTLLINGDQTSASGAVSVANAAALGGSGTLGGAVAVQTGGIVAPGNNAAGTLTLKNGLTLASGTLLNVELGQANVVGGGLNDLVAVTGNLTLAGTVNIVVSSGGTLGVGKYTLFTYSGTLTNNTLSVGTVPSGMSASSMKIDTTTPGQINLVISGTYWDAVSVSKNNNVVNGGIGTWTAIATDSNWTSLSGATNGPWAQDATATFAGTAGTVTVDNTAGAINFGGLSFTTTGYTLTGGTLTGTLIDPATSDVLTAATNVTATIASVLEGTPPIDKKGTGTIMLSGLNTYTGATTVTAGTLAVGAGGTTGSIESSSGVTVASDATLQFNRSDAYTASKVISGAGAVAKASSGTTGLTAINTYSGATTVTVGTLSIGTGGTEGSIDSTSGVAVSSGATLQFNRSDAYAFVPAISGAGALNQAGSGTLTLPGDNTYTGATTVTAGTLVVGNGSTTGSIDSSSGVALSSGTTLQFNRSNAYTSSKVISGAGAVVKASTGTTTLTGANTYTGTTSVNAGTLLINGNQTSANGLTSVASSATLGGNGTVGGAVTLQAGAILAPGNNAAGTLTLKSGLTLNGTSVINAEFGEANLAGGSFNDLVAITGNLTLDGTLNITQTSGRTYSVGKYTLFTYTGTLTDNTLTIGTLPNGMTAGEVRIDLSTPNQVNLVVSGTYWDAVSKNNNVVNGGAGTWTASVTDSNWTSSAGTTNGPWAPDGTAIFQGTAGTVTVDNTAGAINFGGLSFTTTGYTLTGGTLTGTLIDPATSDVLTAAPGVTATIASVLAGTPPIDKQGTGTVNLSGLNTYTGATTVTAGTLAVGAGSTTGSIESSSGVTVASGAILQFNRSDAYAASKVISGAGHMVQSGAGTTTFSAANTYTGPTSVTGGTLSIGAGGTTGSIDSTSGVGVGSGATLQFNRSDAYSFAPVITSPGALRKAGSGTTSLTGANTYTGATTIIAGTFSVGAGGTTGSIDTTSAVAVSSGAALQFNRSNAYTHSKVISGAGGLVQAGTGTTTLSSTNSYTGSTTVSAGTLTAGVANALNSVTAVSVASGATFSVNGNALNIGSVSGAGTLALGTNGTLTLLGTGSTPAAFTGNITGSGTIVLNSGASLVLDANQSNSSVNIHLNGGTLALSSSATRSHALGTLRVLASGSLDFGAGASAGFPTLTLDAGQNLAVSAWQVARSDLLSATLVTGNPLRDTGNLAPLNRITFAGHLATTTNWRSVTNEVTPIPARPKIRLAKISLGGVGSFAFTLTGLSTFTDNVTTVTAGMSAQGATGITGTNAQAVTITESGMPMGWPSNPVSASCVDASGATNGNGTGPLGSLAANVLTLDTALMVPGSDFTCSFVNTLNRVSGLVFNDGGAPSAGVNSGTPNDGLQNGNEAGLPGLTLALTDCASTTHAATSSDGAGAWSLNIPAAQAGSSVCVVATLPLDYLATGANVAGTTTTVNGVPTNVGGVVYTYGRTQQRLAFTAPVSGTRTLNFGQVPVSKLQYDSNRSGQPGGSAVHGHSFVAGTGGSVQISTGPATPTPSMSGWGEAVYLDADCSGKLQAGATKLYPPQATQTVTQGQTVCFVVQQFVPSAALNGNTNSVPVQAVMTFANASPSLTASYAVTDVTTASNSALTLQKEVRNVTTSGTFGASNQAKSGETLMYRITYTNNGAGPLSRVVISDATNAYTTFVSATVDAIPSGLGTCTKNTPLNPLPAVSVACTAVQAGTGTKGTIAWQFTGVLNPGASGSVSYSVVVD